MEYVNKFLRNKYPKSVTDLFARTNNPAKEITESFAILKALDKLREIKNYTKTNWFGNEQTCIVIGDGRTPRTGALIALHTNWKVISVDPLMKAFEVGMPAKKASKLTSHKHGIESCNIHNQDLVCVMVHSHATVRQIQQGLSGCRIDLIEMPCCFPITGHWEYDKVESYVDNNILSPKNTINIYNSIYVEN